MIFSFSPHMRKLYGDQIRKEAGLTKTLRSAAVALPKTIPDELRQEVTKMLKDKSEIQAALSTTKNVERIVKETVEKVERVVEETAGAVGDMVEAARPKLQEMVADTKILLENSTSRLLIPKVTNDLDAYDLSKYSITFSNDPTDNISFTFGEPITLNWQAPPNHGHKDWIGVYKITGNKSKHVTTISSKGLWTWTTPRLADTVEDSSPSDSPRVTEGTVTFRGDKLPWEIGSYEFRYHHDGKHNVMARSRPFDIVGMWYKLSVLLRLIINKH
jgi:phosphatidylethanolamine N-methyltransferase